MERHHLNLDINNINQKYVWHGDRNVVRFVTKPCYKMLCNDANQCNVYAVVSKPSFASTVLTERWMYSYNLSDSYKTSLYNAELVIVL